MKRYLLCILCISMMLVLAGCVNYGDIEAALERVEIESTLPDVREGKYKSIEDAEDAVYEQQIAACEMYNESYDKTYYKQFLDKGKKYKAGKTANICNSYRRKLNDNIKTEFYKNMYKIVKDCEDCTNKEAFLEKTNNDVLGFYDAYIKYKESENKDEELCEILVNYAERRNVFALSFLDRNRTKVYEAAVNVIEKNSDTDENFRLYLNKNNNIISALNDIFDGVPSKYAERISDATTKLSKNLLNSLESLTERERASLMDQLNLSTPSPSPKPTSTPRPSPSPTAEPTEKPTQAPVRTAVPSTKAPENQPVQAPAAVEPEDEEETEDTQRPSYSFSVDD